MAVRGSALPLKDLMAPAKHLFWEGTRGPGKVLLKLQDDDTSIRHGNMSFYVYQWAGNGCMIN